MQKRMKAVNVSGQKQVQRVSKNGRLYEKDISYDSRYPNHYLDIYLVSENRSIVRPTLFYVHGGGFTWGDKATDGNGEGFEWYFERFLKAGYNVVSINYAFAPAHTYPVPILQMGEAIRFLLDHPECGICLDQVVFAGSSAGGQLVGQFCNIETNPAYAKQMGIKPVLGREHLKAVVFQSSLLDVERFGNVDSRFGSRVFICCGEAYFGIPGAWPNSPQIKQANVTEHICRGFPPCYISDGNFNTFTKQARELERRCCALGIPCELHLTPAEEKKVPHSYEIVETEAAIENMEKIITFLERI